MKSRIFTHLVVIATLRTQRFAVTVSFRRFPSSFYESYTPGHLLDLRSHLVAWTDHLILLRWILNRTSSDTASTWCVCGTQNVRGTFWPTSLHIRRDSFVDSKGSVNLLRISYVSLTSLHIRRDASVEINPPAGLSSIHSPPLGRVWYHAPWWRRYRRYRRCGQRLFGHLLW